DVIKALMVALMSGVGDADQVKVLAPAAQWGFTAANPADDDEVGVVVKEVLASSPAAKAGLQPKDRLMTVDGRWTDSLVDLFAAVEKIPPGTEVKVHIRRAG